MTSRCAGEMAEIDMDTNKGPDAVLEAPKDDFLLEAQPAKRAEA